MMDTLIKKEGNIIISQGMSDIVAQHAKDQQMKQKTFLQDYLSNFYFNRNVDLFENKTEGAITEHIEINGTNISRYVNEFWTSKQRQASNIHEVAYRACFKPQLPRFFINLLTKPEDIVYDPFSGRGYTVLEAALLNRNIISNDINPLSRILSYPRLFIPDITELETRLYSLPFSENAKEDIDLSMFYHPKTEAEIISLRNYLEMRRQNNLEDEIDQWIRMVATNRLTGHSSGFFSVYTLPPNQAVSPERQSKINEKRKQRPDYRDTRGLILKKTKSLIKDVKYQMTVRLREIGLKACFLTKDARFTSEIDSNSVQLTVTSPPFLDVVQYVNDNWLRCWFNSIDSNEITKKITVTKKLEDWCDVMGKVFDELFRITRPGGYVAFEVGEIRNGKLKLEEYVVPLGLKTGFSCDAIMINQQEFTKTANIWGISNMEKGTNTNRIVIFRKK